MKPKNWQLSFFVASNARCLAKSWIGCSPHCYYFWPVSLALTWLVAQGLANKPFDRALIYNAQALAQLVKLSPDQQRIQFNLPQPASELLRRTMSDLVYYQVRWPQR
jgi:two-component system sensor histidine kinase TctE